MKKTLLLISISTLFLVSCQQSVEEFKVSQIIGNEIVSEDGRRLEIAGLVEPGTTTFILVRHAEKQVGDNPDLTDHGIECANRLAAILKDFPLKSIFSTYTKRTRATVAPCSEMQGVESINYSFENQGDLIKSILKHGAGENYLIVGHSNTIPSLLNLFKGNEVYENIDENVYDDLFIVMVKSSGDAEIVELKY
jgi:phosphohistidine phosphatase SixA